jgi:hypothetical protein
MSYLALLLESKARSLLSALFLERCLDNILEFYVKRESGKDLQRKKNKMKKMSSLQQSNKIVSYDISIKLNQLIFLGFFFFFFDE